LALKLGQQQEDKDAAVVIDALCDRLEAREEQLHDLKAGSPEGGRGGQSASEEEHGLGMVSAAMLLMTWSTSSSNVMYPWTFGILGLMTGPIFMLMAFACNYMATQYVIAYTLETKAKTLGELGRHLGGKWGEYVLAGSQILFSQLWLPVAVVLSVDAIQAVFPHNEWWQCNVNPTLIFVIMGFFLANVARNLGHAQVLAYISVGLLFVMSFCLLLALMNTESTAGDGSKEKKNSWELSIFQGHHPERYAWYNVFSALGVFIYSCLPNCIIVETMATMKDPSEMQMAAKISFGFYISVYFLTGIIGCLYWGGDVALPMTSVMQDDFWGITANLILIYCTMLDFVLGATTVNRAVQRVLAPNYDYAWDTKGTVKWFLLTLPSTILSTLMALLIPKLESLTGLLNSVTGSTLQLTGIAVLVLCQSQLIDGTSKWPVGIVAFAGSFLTVVVFSSTIYFISETDYGEGSFWCDVVGR